MEIRISVTSTPGFGRDDATAEVTLDYVEDDVLLARTRCKSAYDGLPLRCWGMRWPNDETCSGDGIPLYLFKGEEEVGYAICAKHAMVWRQTYRDRSPYTISSWTPPDLSPGRSG